MGVMAQYYGLPWLSYRAVSWHEYMENQPGFSLNETFLGDDYLHPNERGHGCVIRQIPNRALPGLAC